MHRPISVLLIEDNIDLSETISDYLNDFKVVCDIVHQGETGLHFAEQNRYDTIILDISLPRMNGLEVCSKLRQSGNDTPVLMLTARDQLNDKIAGFECGADDYLVKPFALKELMVRIRSLADRKSGEAKLIKIGDLEINLLSHTATRNGRKLRLSPTGWQLLVYLVKQSPRLVPRSELEYLIWQDNPPDSNSLKTHLFKLKHQLQKPHESPMLETVRSQGVSIVDTN